MGYVSLFFFFTVNVSYSFDSWIDTSKPGSILDMSELQTLEATAPDTTIRLLIVSISALIMYILVSSIYHTRYVLASSLSSRMKRVSPVGPRYAFRDRPRPENDSGNNPSNAPGLSLERSLVTASRGVPDARSLIDHTYSLYMPINGYGNSIIIPDVYYYANPG